MNLIQQLRDYLRDAHPDATLTLSPPLNRGGVWSLDVDLADKHLAVEWTQAAGFGVSSVSAETVAERPDEYFESLPEVQRRISELLTSNEETSPPLGVLLSRLRERKGITQQQLATKLGIRQATVSGMERRGDIQFSTLKRTIEALGGHLEVSAVFPEARYGLNRIADEAPKEDQGTAGNSDTTYKYGDVSFIARPVQSRQVSGNLRIECRAHAINIASAALLREKAVARVLDELIEMFEVRVHALSEPTKNPSLKELLNYLFGSDELSSFSQALRRSLLVKCLLKKNDDRKKESANVRDLLWETVAAQSVSGSTRIDTEHTIGGLAALAQHVADFAPDVVVTLNPGGAVLGQFLKCQLRLQGVRFAHLVGRESFEVSGVLPAESKRTIVVDSTARTGFTVNNALNWTCSQCEIGMVGLATLAASSTAISRLGNILYTPNPSLGPVERLPYDTSKGFDVIEERGTPIYVFGANATSFEDKLMVPVTTINKLIVERQIRVKSALEVKHVGDQTPPDVLLRRPQVLS